MALTVAAKSYVADGFSSDSVHFQGPGKTSLLKDDIVQKRFAPKPTTANSGSLKYLLKLVRSHTLTGAKTITGDGSVELMITRPVGISDADTDLYLTDLGAYIASAAFKTLVKTSQVNG
jgi:hypothetical protein